MPNGYEDANRLRKAVALADICAAFGLSHTQAQGLTAGQRLDVASAAGMKVPSDEAWAVVVETLRRRELHQARAENAIAGALPADPFAGLPS